MRILILAQSISEADRIVMRLISSLRKIPVHQDVGSFGGPTARGLMIRGAAIQKGVQVTIGKRRSNVWLYIIYNVFLTSVE